MPPFLPPAPPPAPKRPRHKRREPNDGSWSAGEVARLIVFVAWFVVVFGGAAFALSLGADFAKRLLQNGLL